MRTFTLTVHLSDEPDAAEDLEECLDYLQERLEEGGLDGVASGECEGLKGFTAAWRVEQLPTTAT